MASNQFNGFDNTTSPGLTDYQVGYGTVAGVTKEKRWLVSAWKTFWQGVLNITDLDREQTNYVRITGSVGNPLIRPAGASTNVGLELTGKGSGSVIISSPLEINEFIDMNGNDIEMGGGNLLMAGGAINTVNGNIFVGTGDLSIAGGSLTMNGGTLNSNGSTWTVDSTTINMTGTALNIISGGIIIASGALQVSDIFPTGAGVTLYGTTFLSDVVVNLSISADELIGTIVAVPANDNVELDVSGVVVFQDDVVHNGRIFSYDDIICDAFIKGSAAMGLTADATSIQGGGLITREFNEYATVATIGDCATLPVLSADNPGSGAWVTYTKVIVVNNGANAMDVFPNTSGTIDGGAADAAISVAAGASVTLYGVDVGGVDTWTTVA